MNAIGRKFKKVEVPQLLECLHTEIDVEASAEFINSIADSIEVGRRLSCTKSESGSDFECNCRDNQRIEQMISGAWQ